MGRFEVGKLYSVQEVHDAVGGEWQTYLPQKNGVIVAGRFSLEMNPEAPERIYPADKPQVRKKARLLVAQDGAIPVFVKERRRDRRFEYLGKFVGTQLSEDPSDLANASRLSGRQNLAYVLTLRRVSN